LKPILVLIVATVLTTIPVSGQSIAPDRSTARLITGGVAGFVAGAVAGGLTAYAVYESSCSGPCEIGGLAAVAGAGAGSMIGTPLGVHLANDRRGSFAATLFGAAATLGLGVAAMHVAQSVIDDDQVVNGMYALIGVAIPVVQIGISIGIQRRTGPGPSR
jgi:hypothetical protein